MQNLATDIERKLKTLVGFNVRLKVRRISPDGRRFTFANELVFPDGFRADGLPVFYEGEVKAVERRIGVILVALGTPTFSNHVGDGLIQMRGKLCAIASGPAIVELEFPFSVEKLPTDETNYWGDLRLPTFQFELPFEAYGGDNPAT